MRRKIIFGVSALVLFLLVGIGYLLLGYEIRNQLNISFNSPFWDSVVGVSIMILGVIVFILILTTDFLKKVRKYGRRYWFIFIIFDILKWIILIILGLLILKGSYNISQSVV